MESLSKLLGRDIDLVEEKAIRNPVFRNIVEKNKDENLWMIMPANI